MCIQQLVDIANNYPKQEPKFDNSLVFRIVYLTHSLKLRPGGANSRNEPGVWLWYSDSTRRAKHAHIEETSQGVAESEIRVLWSWTFWRKISTFSGYN